GGAIIVQSRVRTGTPVIAVRPNSAAPEAAPGAAEVEQVSISVSDAAKTTRITGRVVQERGERPELTEASIVVSGGRGVGAGENFTLIEKLAGTRPSSRWARPARRSRLSCTWRWASPARSSTARACRRRRRSWWSTRT